MLPSHREWQRGYCKKETEASEREGEIRSEKKREEEQVDGCELARDKEGGRERERERELVIQELHFPSHYALVPLFPRPSTLELRKSLYSVN
jgi:hypothetical protein